MPSCFLLTYIQQGYLIHDSDLVATSNERRIECTTSNSRWQHQVGATQRADWLVCVTCGLPFQLVCAIRHQWRHTSVSLKCLPLSVWTSAFPSASVSACSHAVAPLCRLRGVTERGGSRWLDVETAPSGVLEEYSSAPQH